jgi:hypothetical protein
LLFNNLLGIYFLTASREEGQVLPLHNSALGELKIGERGRGCLGGNVSVCVCECTLCTVHYSKQRVFIKEQLPKKMKNIKTACPILLSDSLSSAAMP